MKKVIVLLEDFFLTHNLVYECKVNSMKFDISGISEWKPKDIYDSLNKNVLNSVRNTKLFHLI